MNEINITNNIITIIYSIGIGSIKNKEKEDNINKMIELFEPKFNLKVIKKYHDLSISCLKLIKTLGDENHLLFRRMVDYQETSLQKSLNFQQKYSGFISNTIALFRESIFNEYNLIFYFDDFQMRKLSKKFDFKIL